MLRTKRTWILGLALTVAFWGYSPAARAFDDHGQDQGGQSGQSGDQDGNHGNDGQDNGQENDQNNGQNNDQNNGQNNPTDQENTESSASVPFAVQPAGAAIAATGQVDLRSDSQGSGLKVEAEANVPDGTAFTVFANAPSASACAQGVPLGTVQSSLGEIELEFDSQEGPPLPGGLSASAISSVCVADGSGTPLLSAQFGLPPAPASTTLPAAGVQRSKVPLVPAPAGASLAADGKVELRVQGQTERLKVEFAATAPAGATFAVVGIANNTPYVLGTLTLQRGEAELRLDNQNSTPPVQFSSLAQVQITTPDGATVLLSASLPH